MPRMFSWSRSFFCTSCCILSLHAHASPLNEVFSNAKTVDETYLSALANFEATQELVAQAVAPLLPNVSVSSQNMNNILNKNEGAGPLPQQNYKSSSRTLAIRQPIIRPAAWIQLKQSSAQSVGAQYELVRAENELVIRVVSAYLDGLLADEQLRAIDAQVHALQNQLAATTLSFQQGYSTKVDIADVQNRLDQVIVDQLQVKSAKIYAIEQLRLFSGHSQTPPLKIKNDTQIASARPLKLQEWLDLALERNADILVSRFRVEVVSQEILKSYAGHLPTLDFVAQVSNSNNENIQFPATTFSNKQYGLQMNVPLFSGGSVLSATRQAVALANKEERLFNATVNNVRLQITKEYNSFIDGLQRIKANLTAVNATQQALLATKKNQEAGYKSRLDVVNAQQKVFSSEKELMLAKYQCMLGLLKLNLLSGESAEQALHQVEEFLQPSLDQAK